MSRGLIRSLVQLPSQNRASQGFRPGYSGICPGGSWNPPVEERVYLGNLQHCWTVLRKLFLIHSPNLSTFTFSLFSVILVSHSCGECDCGSISIAELLLDPSELSLNHNKQASSLSLLSQGWCSSSDHHQWPPLTLLHFVNVFPDLGKRANLVPVLHVHTA